MVRRGLRASSDRFSQLSKTFLLQKPWDDRDRKTLKQDFSVRKASLLVSAEVVSFT